MSDDDLNALGTSMAARIAQLHDSMLEKLHVRGRAALLRGL